MRKYLTIIVLSLFPTFAIASNCDTQGSKDKVEQCYKKEIKSKKEALDEYVEAIKMSDKIPPAIKMEVENDYKSFIKNIPSFCPDSSCISMAMSEHLKDMYSATRVYIIP